MRPARADPTLDDQARPGARGPDHPAREDRARERAGHRREHDARAREPEARHRTRRTRTERTRDAIADVGLYRAVSYTDLSDTHFDGHPFTTRRLVTQMTHAGLIEEHEATGPRGNTFTVLTATERGRDAAYRAAVDAGHAAEQRTWSGLVKPAELSHDTAVYRAALDERARIEAEGGRVVRVRLDAELKAIVATATEKARAEAGDRAADAAKRAAATELGLQHMRALPHGAVADALATVRTSQVSVTIKQAFEFLVLTAARSGEVRLATWDEMGLDAGVWALPAARMKAKRDHRVPLSSRALAILHDVQRLSDGTGLVFRSLRGKPLSAVTLPRLTRELCMQPTMTSSRSICPSLRQTTSAILATR